MGSEMPAKSNHLPPEGTLRLTIPGDPVAVRAGLQTLFDTVLLRSLPQEGRGMAELVLAEALNNIVEHAYARYSGEIEVTLALDPQGLACQIADTGLPMPKGELPFGALKTMDPDEDLPEGGFGWFLIRSLSQDLEYERDGARNLLSFRLKAKQSAPE